MKGTPKSKHRTETKERKKKSPTADGDRGTPSSHLPRPFHPHPRATDSWAAPHAFRPGKPLCTARLQGGLRQRRRSIPGMSGIGSWKRPLGAGPSPPAPGPQEAAGSPGPRSAAGGGRPGPGAEPPEPRGCAAGTRGDRPAPVPRVEARRPREPPRPRPRASAVPAGRGPSPQQPRARRVRPGAGRRPKLPEGSGRLGRAESSASRRVASGRGRPRAAPVGGE